MRYCINVAAVFVGVGNFQGGEVFIGITRNCQFLVALVGDLVDIVVVQERKIQGFIVTACVPSLGVFESLEGLRMHGDIHPVEYIFNTHRDCRRCLAQEIKFRVVVINAFKRVCAYAFHSCRNNDIVTHITMIKRAVGYCFKRIGQAVQSQFFRFGESAPAYCCNTVVERYGFQVCAMAESIRLYYGYARRNVNPSYTIDTVKRISAYTLKGFGKVYFINIIYFRERIFANPLYSVGHSVFYLGFTVGISHKLRLVFCKENPVDGAIVLVCLIYNELLRPAAYERSFAYALNACRYRKRSIGRGGRECKFSYRLQ